MKPTPPASNITNSSTVGQVYNTFYHVLKDLEPYIQADTIRLAIDHQGRVFVCGQNFGVQLQSDFGLHRQLRAEIQGIIAQHCPRTAS